MNADESAQAAQRLLAAWQDLDQLAAETVVFDAGGVVLGRCAKEPVVWGRNEHLTSTGGLVAMELYEILNLGGSGVTLELVDPEGHWGGSQYTKRTVLLKLAEPARLTDDQTSMVAQLDAVEDELNKKGWSLG